MSSEIVFSADLSVEDFAAWTVHLHKLSRERHKKLSYLIMALILAAIIGWPIINLWRGASPDADFICMLKNFFARQAAENGLPLAVGAVVYVYLSSEKTLRSILYRQFRSLVGFVGGVDQTELYEYRLDEEAVLVKRPAATFIFHWPAFRYFGETPEHFFTAYSFAAVVVIPKRALSAEQTDAVRALLTRKIGRAAGG